MQNCKIAHAKTASLGATVILIITKPFPFPFFQEAGHGEVVGRLPDDAMQDNEEYQEVRKEFVRRHGVQAFLNLVTLCFAFMPV